MNDNNSPQPLKIDEGGLTFFSESYLLSDAVKAVKDTKTVVSEVTGITYTVEKIFHINPRTNARTDFVEVTYTPQQIINDSAASYQRFFIVYQNIELFKKYIQSRRNDYRLFPGDLDNRVKNGNWYKQLANDSNPIQGYQMLIQASCFEIINAIEQAKLINVLKFTLITSQHFLLKKDGVYNGQFIKMNTSAYPNVLLEANLENSNPPDQQMIPNLKFYYYKNINESQPKELDFQTQGDYIKKEMLKEVKIVAKGIESRIYTFNACPSLTERLMKSYDPSSDPQQNSGGIPVFNAPNNNFTAQPEYTNLPSVEEQNLLILPEKTQLSNEIKERINELIKQKGGIDKLIVKIIKNRAIYMNPIYYFNVSKLTKNQATTLLTSVLGRVSPDDQLILRLAMEPSDMKKILGEEGISTTNAAYSKEDRVISVFQNIGKKIALELSKIKSPAELPLIDVPLEVLMSVQASTSYSVNETANDEEAILFDMSNYSRFPVDPTVKTSTFGGKKNNLLSLTPLESESQIRAFKYLIERNKKEYPKPKPYTPSGPLIKEITNYENADGVENWKEIDSEYFKPSLAEKRAPRRDVAILSRRVAVDSTESTMIEMGHAITNEDDGDESISEGENEYE